MTSGTELQSPHSTLSFLASSPNRALQTVVTVDDRLLAVPAQQSDDVGTAVVTVVGAALLLVLGLWLTYLALRTRASVPSAQAALWEYFGFVGIVGAVSGAAILFARWLSASVPFRSGLLLAFALCVAFAMREAYYNATLANAEIDRLGDHHLRRSVEVAFVGLVLVTAVGPIVRPSAAFTVLAALAGVAVVAYGLAFQHRRTSAVATRGTVIDSLARHSVPVLVFAGGAVVSPALALGATSEPVARAVGGVFVLVAATSLLPVAIKLDQHRSAHT